MTVHLSAIGNAFQFFNSIGRPLSLGKLYSYAAGTTTPATTYTDNTGGSANANPILLDASGRLPNEVWLTDATAYKFVLQDALGNTLGTYDNIVGINDQTGLVTLAALAASSGSALVGFLQAGTGAVSRTVQSKLRDIVSVKDFGAVGDGFNDDTAAIQAAVNTGKAVYFPIGTYKITSSIIISTIGQLLFGAAMELTIIAPSGAIRAIVSSGGLVRFNLRDLAITGNSSTLDAIDTSSGTLYESNWQNLSIYVGGRALYAPVEFSNTFTNITFGSLNNHGLEIAGDVGTTLIGCYCHRIDTNGKYGYRVYSGGTYIGCNGLDYGENWGLFGSAVAKGDARDLQYAPVFIGCNFEDFRKVGIRFRYNGIASFHNCTFFPPAVITSPTYDCSVYIEFCDRLIQFHNTGTTPKGAARNKLAEIFSDAGGAPLNFGSYSSWDDNGVLTTMPNVTTSGAEFAVFAMNVNAATFGRAYGFYSPGIPVWTANATTFSVAAIDRVQTANSVGTVLNTATGGVDGQMLVVYVRDTHTTIKHLAGSTGQFLNKSGADIVATNGQPYLYFANGGTWVQI